MKLRILSATAVAALGVTGQLSAFADAPDVEDSRRLEVVTVTTQKTEQSLIDVPINISVTDFFVANRDDAVDHSLLHAPWQG